MSRLGHSLFLASVGILLVAAPLQALTISISSDSQVTVIDDSVLGEQDASETPEKSPKPSNLQEKRLPKSSNDERKLKIESRIDGIKVKSETKRNPQELDEEVKRLEIKMPAGSATGQRKTGNRENLKRSTEFEDDILIQRDSRSDEDITIHNQDGKQGERLLLESRAVRAKFPDKPITIDPETKEVILQLKNGETRVLTTLPDQAVERFQASGELSKNDELNFDSLEVEVTDDNQVKYTAKVVEQRRFLGFINRQLEKKVVLDDSTGEVSTEESGKTSLLDRVINRFSF